MVSTDTAHLYIIPNRSLAAPLYVGGTLVSNGPYGYQDLLDCKLYNASYEAFLNFSYTSQNIDIRSRDLLNPVNVLSDFSDWWYGTADNAPRVPDGRPQQICYQSIMDSLGRLLVGNEWQRDGFTTTDKTSWAMMSIDWTARDTARQGVEELFQNITLSMLSSTSLV